MSDWKPGDRFKLECEGTVVQSITGLRVILDGPGEIPPVPSVAVHGSWFDVHATKIQHPCSAITLQGIGAAMPCGEVAVQRVSHLSHETRYFCKKHRVEAEDL